MTDDTQRFFGDEPAQADLSASSDAISVSFAQVDSAEDFESMAHELRAAAEHCHRAAKHMLNGRVPRGCAHGFAAEGHMRRATRLLEELAIRHADHAGFEEGGDDAAAEGG